jgi:phytol kinase
MDVHLSPFYWFGELKIDPFVGIQIALLSLFIVFGAGTLAGYIKKEKGIKTNYTRKIFHFIVFTSATIIHWQFGLPGTAIFGTSALLFLIISIYRGDGSIIYEGIAREQDKPQRSFYLIVPFIATAVAGVMGNILFMGWAMVGYLVIGWGDAVGEPFGVKFGKHKYRVFTLTGIKCHRSLEGSAAVFIASALAASIVLANPIYGVIIGMVAALLESQSPHGGDNFTVQLGATATAFLLAWLLPMPAFW